MSNRKENPGVYTWADAHSGLDQKPVNPCPPALDLYVDADEYDRVLAEVERLRAEVEEKHRLNMQYANEVLTLRAELAEARNLLNAAEDQECDEIQALRAEVERYRKAIERHRANVWGCPVTREVGHPEDVNLYAALGGGEVK